jgi:hypothetical protein
MFRLFIEGSRMFVINGSAHLTFVHNRMLRLSFILLDGGGNWCPCLFIGNRGFLFTFSPQLDCMQQRIQVANSFLHACFQIPQFESIAAIGGQSTLCVGQAIHGATIQERVQTFVFDSRGTSQSA